MTNDELNEIFRAIRHRRTLSWKTIEMLAMENRQLRAQIAEERQAAAKLKAQVGCYIPTVAFPPKSAAKLPDLDSPPISPMLRDYLQTQAVRLQQKRENAIMDAILFGKSTFTCNIDPTKDDVDKIETTLLPQSKG